jgi:molecular chaperone DnaK (HSP70)
MKLLPYEVVCVDGEKPCVQVQWNETTRILTPEEISAMILVRMKETADAYLGIVLRSCHSSLFTLVLREAS